MGVGLGAVAKAHAHILVRRRTTLAVLAALPLAFYGALYQHSDHAITVGGVASAFSVAGAGIFSMVPARAADQRLVLALYGPASLILGRLLVLETVSLAMSALTSAVMIAGTGPTRPADVLIGVILVGGIAAPLGLALGALLSRELEATLVLIGVVGIQLTTESDTNFSRVLPFGAPGQLLDASTGAVAAIWPRVAAGLAYAAVLLAIAWLAWLRRTTPRGRVAQLGRSAPAVQPVQRFPRR
jgi:hypothetical protein